MLLQLIHYIRGNLLLNTMVKLFPDQKQRQGRRVWTVCFGISFIPGGMFCTDYSFRHQHCFSIRLSVPSQVGLSHPHLSSSTMPSPWSVPSSDQTTPNVFFLLPLIFVPTVTKFLLLGSHFQLFYEYAVIHLITGRWQNYYTLTELLYSHWVSPCFMFQLWHC